MQNMLQALSIYLIFAVCLYVLQLQYAPSDQIQLFGDRRFALFDLWTLQHIATGFVLGYLLIKNRFNAIQMFIIVLLCSSIWEVFELFAEIGVFGQSIQSWKFGYELVVNRIITDPGSMLLGAYMSTKWIFLIHIMLSLCLFGPSIISLLKHHKLHRIKLLICCKFNKCGLVTFLK